MFQLGKVQHDLSSVINHVSLWMSRCETQHCTLFCVFKTSCSKPPVQQEIPRCVSTLTVTVKKELSEACGMMIYSREPVLMAGSMILLSFNPSVMCCAPMIPRAQTERFLKSDISCFRLQVLERI